MIKNMDEEGRGHRDCHFTTNLKPFVISWHKKTASKIETVLINLSETKF